MVWKRRSKFLLYNNECMRCPSDEPLNPYHSNALIVDEKPHSSTLVSLSVSSSRIDSVSVDTQSLKTQQLTGEKADGKSRKNGIGRLPILYVLDTTVEMQSVKRRSSAKPDGEYYTICRDSKH